MFCRNYLNLLGLNAQEASVETLINTKANLIKRYSNGLILIIISTLSLFAVSTSILDLRIAWDIEMKLVSFLLFSLLLLYGLYLVFYKKKERKEKIKELQSEIALIDKLVVQEKHVLNHIRTQQKYIQTL